MYFLKVLQYDLNIFVIVKKSLNLNLFGTMFTFTSMFFVYVLLFVLFFYLGLNMLKVLGFFHEHWQLTGQQGKGKTIF